MEPGVPLSLVVRLLSIKRDYIKVKLSASDTGRLLGIELGWAHSFIHMNFIGSMGLWCLDHQPQS